MYDKEKKEISFNISNALQYPGSKCQGLHVASKMLPMGKDLTGTQPDPAEVAPLGACSGCFSGCKRLYNFHSLQLSSKSTGLEEKALTIFSTVMQKLKKEGYNIGSNIQS